MKIIKFSSLLVLLVLSMFLGTNVKHAQASLPEKPLPCNSDEIEPNDSMNTATSVCSNDVGTVYGEVTATDVDYFREDNYFDGSDFTIRFDNNNREDVRLELLDDSGKIVDGVVTNIYPYGLSYYYHRLEMGTYYFKVYFGNESSSSEPLKYALMIKQNVFRTGWFFGTSNYEFWQDGVKFDGTRWIKYKNQWFYIKDGARQQNGWIVIGTKRYYLTPNTGVMKTGWLLDNGKWFYFNKTTGAMQTGWVFDGGKWYFLDQTGTMKTGWVFTDGKWYYLLGSGEMKTGWLYEGGKWYYLNTNGSMATGWNLVNGKWYYLYSNGKMAYSTWIGKYKLGADGAWVN